MPSDTASKVGARWRPGRLARNGAILLGWMLLRAAAQVALVVLLARMLGAQSYGQVVAVVATASFLAPFAGLGLSHMLLRNAARDPVHKGTYFAIAQRWWWRTLLPCAVLAMVLAMVLLPEGLPLAAVCAATVVEIAAASATELWARYRQAEQRIHAYGAINAGLSLVRALALGLLFWFVADASAAAVLWVYAASGLSYLLLMGAMPRMAPEPGSAKEGMGSASGLPFSLSGFAMRLQGEFNKPVLAQVGFDLASGYNVAQRALDMASLPLAALQEALWPRLYAQAHPVRQLCRSGLALVVLALGLGAVIWLTAPLLPRALGPDFSQAVNVLRWLAWLPTLQLLRYFIHFYVIYRSWTPIIGWTYGLGAMTNLLLVTSLVPLWSLGGAVISAYLTELCMTLILLVACLRRHRHIYRT